jgi:hypothetical protein
MEEDMLETQVGVIQLQAKESRSHQKLGGAKKGFHQESQREQPFCHLDFRLWPT